MSEATHAKKRHALRIILAVAILCAVSIVAAMVAGLFFYKQVQTVKHEEEQAISAISGLNGDMLKNPSALEASVSQAQQHTARARQVSHNPLWTVASIMPYVGNDITTVRGMAEVMDNLTHNTLPGFTRIAKTINETQLSNTNGQLDLQTIADMQDDFSSINNQLQKQRTTYDNLPTPKIAIVATAYRQGHDKLDTIVKTVYGMNSAMQMVPELLGQNGVRTYLLAIQTPSEQRSGGGLVGSLGTFHTDHGAVTVGDLHPDGTLLNGGNANADEGLQRPTPVLLRPPRHVRSTRHRTQRANAERHMAALAVRVRYRRSVGYRSGVHPRNGRYQRRCAADGRYCAQRQQYCAVSAEHHL